MVVTVARYTVPFHPIITCITSAPPLPFFDLAVTIGKILFTRISNNTISLNICKTSVKRQRLFFSLKDTVILIFSLELISI